MGVINVHNKAKPELGRKLSTLIKATHSDHPLIFLYAAAFDQASTDLDDAMKPRIKGVADSETATEAVNEKDEVRDDEYRAFFYLLLAYATQRHDPALRETAQALLTLLVSKQLSIVDLPNAQESTELETLLGNAQGAEAQIATLPGAPAFVVGLRSAQDAFSNAVQATPALRQALTNAVKAVHEAAEVWDGVLSGYLGILRQAFPGKSQKTQSEREKLLGPLREVQAAGKAKKTVRDKTKKAKKAVATPPAPTPVVTDPPAAPPETPADTAGR